MQYTALDYRFLNDIMRAEYHENPRVYKKAIRAVLIALGYKEQYVNGQFRKFMDRYYEQYFDEETDSRTTNQ